MLFTDVVLPGGMSGPDLSEEIAHRRGVEFPELAIRAVSTRDHRLPLWPESGESDLDA